jgi:hypothetical protein
MNPNQKTCWNCGVETEYHIYTTETGEFRTCKECEEELQK